MKILSIGIIGCALAFAAPALAFERGTTGDLPASFNSEGGQAPAFPSPTANYRADAAAKAQIGCMHDIRKSGSC